MLRTTITTEEVADEAILEVRDLGVVFPTGNSLYHIIDGLNLLVRPGECVGVVGESGSGKSMACLALLGLVPAPGRVLGEVRLGGRDLSSLSRRELRAVRGKQIAMVFQDPSASLNPLLSVRAHIRDVLAAHDYGDRKAVAVRVLEVLEEVRFPNPQQRMDAFPFQLSGGLRQRVAIAMALACHPKVVVADEPTTNLDVSVQDQILSLLVAHMRRDQFGMVFVSHDLGVISQVADSIIVMYGGQVVESGPAALLLASPQHPYTRGLLAAAPTMSMSRADRLQPIPGSLVRRPGPLGGCVFAPRCPSAEKLQCHPSAPEWHPVPGAPGHTVYCHRPESVVAQ